jgi:hypothetical protein
MSETQCKLVILVALASATLACDAQDPADTQRRLEGVDLSRWGVAEVLVSSSAGAQSLRASLIDASGDVIGEVGYASDGSTVAMLVDDEVTSRVVGTTMEIECNGESLRLATDAGTVSVADTERIAPCGDALDVAAVLLPKLRGSSDSITAPAPLDADTRSSLALTDPSAEPSEIALDCVYWRTEGCVSWSEGLGCEVTQYCTIWTCAWGDFSAPWSDYECYDQPVIY